MKRIILSFMLSLAVIEGSGQGAPKYEPSPELVMTVIHGAPVLENPVLVNGSFKPVISEGHGLAAPAFYDMNGDGMRDLLIGEFGSGMEHGKYMGNFIRVYLNIGTEQQPEFTGKFQYARPPFEYQVEAHGTPYSVDQFCCVGFTPQFTDLDQDEFMDVITGTYQGEVSWFRGSEIGFHAGTALQQEGNPRGSTWVKDQPYWLFSSASFGDFTGDGLADLITGGSSLRISRNIGTKEAPAFGKRELLLDTEGSPLRVFSYAYEDSMEFKRYDTALPAGGDLELSPYAVDWNNDGLIDLLVTSSYSHADLDAVVFFECVRSGDDLRFRKGVPLFRGKGNVKALPGSAPHIFVTDWNGDKVNDLLIGTSIITTNDQYNAALSWRWEKELNLLGPGKDPANLNEDNLTADQLTRYKEDAKLPEGIMVDEYMTLRHQGHVYLLVGKKMEKASSHQGNTNTKKKKK